MELDDLKKTWKAAKTPAEEQENVNPGLLEKMNDRKYRSQVKKVTIPEMAGSIVCLAGAVFIGSSFGKLNTVLLQGAGVISILLLLLLPILSAVSTWRLSATGNLDKPYAATLKAFANQKLRFVKLQKLNVTLSYLLLVTIIVLLPRLFGGNDLSGNKYFWLFSITIGYIFLLFYSKWVEKYYRKTLQQAEELLKELAV